MIERFICPKSSEPCEFEGYCAIWKDLVSPGTQIADDKVDLLKGTTPEQAVIIERIYGYCATDRLGAAQDVLDDPLASIDAKLGAYMTRDTVTRQREPYRQVS